MPPLRISASLPSPAPPPRCRCHRMRAKRGAVSLFQAHPGVRLINRILPSSLRGPPRVILKRGQLAVGGGGCWKGTAAGDESRGGGGVVLDMIGCQTGVNPGFGHTPPRLNPPLERMAAGVRVFLERGLIEILVVAMPGNARGKSWWTLDGWKRKKGLR